MPPRRLAAQLALRYRVVRIGSTAGIDLIVSEAHDHM